jgi:hypothetical protein
MASFQRKRAAAEIDYETFFLINLEHKKFQHQQLCNQVWENLATHCFKSAESTNKSFEKQKLSRSQRFDVEFQIADSQSVETY